MGTDLRRLLIICAPSVSESGLVQSKMESASNSAVVFKNYLFLICKLVTAVPKAILVNFGRIAGYLETWVSQLSRWAHVTRQSYKLNRLFSNKHSKVMKYEPSAELPEGCAAILRQVQGCAREGHKKIVSIQTKAQINIFLSSKVYRSGSILLCVPGTIFAQKSISKKSIAPELFTEIKMHLALAHPNIVNLYHIYSEEGYVQLIMDYAGESLFSLRKNNKICTVGYQNTTASILKQLISAVSYLHHRKIVHADIKLENILYLEGVVKLCDFGFAHVSNPQAQLHANQQFSNSNKENQISKDIVGTLEYLDPEYVQGRKSQFSRDIWAIGIVAFELLIGRNPFEGMAENQKWSTILKIQEIPTKNLNISPQMHRLLELTLCPIDQRGTIWDLQNLQIFTKGPEYYKIIESGESKVIME